MIFIEIINKCLTKGWKWKYKNNVYGIWWGFFLFCKCSSTLNNKNISSSSSSLSVRVLSLSHFNQENAAEEEKVQDQVWDENTSTTYRIDDNFHKTAFNSILFDKLILQ